VDPAQIFAAHKQEQRSRVSYLNELVIVSDTTELVFPRHPSKEGLGDIGNSEMDLEGVKLHSTIGVNPQTHRMTGVIDQQALIEDQQADEKYDANGKGEPIQLESEQEKWIRGDRQARDWLADDVRPLFVHDRGADAFAFYNELVEEMANAGFVVRANQNRRIWTESGDAGKLFDWSCDLAGVVCTTFARSCEKQPTSDAGACCFCSFRHPYHESYAQTLRRPLELSRDPENRRFSDDNAGSEATEWRSREGIQRPQKSEISGVRTNRGAIRPRRHRLPNTLRRPAHRPTSTTNPICIICVKYGVATRKNISIRDDQEEWIQDNHLNLSSFVQEKLDELIEQRES
jgi:hypothetical protein